MKLKKTLFVVTILSITSASPISAGKIRDACLKSDRNAASQTCSCIQQVADAKLSNRDQSLAATFFKDPQKAQDIRQSSNPTKEKFWLRYKAFGELAAMHCS